MTRQHHTFCDIEPTQRGHGQFCVSRPVAREAAAIGESGMNIDVTVDLVARWADLTSPRMVRAVLEPPNVQGRFVALMPPGTARTLAAVLLAAAAQAEELVVPGHDVGSGRMILT
jgi:hypothetical protein